MRVCLCCGRELPMPAWALDGRSRDALDALDAYDNDHCRICWLGLCHADPDTEREHSHP